MKVARKGVKFFITALFVGGLSFGATYFFTHNNVQETFAKIEEKIEDSELVKTVEKIVNKEEKSEKEEEFDRAAAEIKARYEKHEEEKARLKQELSEDRELQKNVDEARKRLEEFEKNYEESLKKLEEIPEEETTEMAEGNPTSSASHTATQK